MGKQSLSHCATAPSMKFSSTGRDQWSRVLITKGHSDMFRGKHGADPGTYNVANSTLQQRTTEFGMYKSERPDPGKHLPGVKAHHGPAKYDLEDEHGRIRVREHRKGLARNIVFGTANRFRTPAGGSGSLGPGEYGVPACPTNELPRVRDTTFGAPFKVYDSVLIHPNSAKVGEEVLKGREGPGPGEARETILNKKAYRFLKAQRFPKTQAERRAQLDEPCPGTYKPEQVKHAIRTEPSVLSDLPNSTVPAFGQPPRKARFNAKALLNQSSDLNAQIF